MMGCYYGDYINAGGVSGRMSEVRKAELLRLHQAQHARTCRRPCRVCGAEDCGKPECLRAILATEEKLDLRRRLGAHAEAAARDAGLRQNGAGQR